MREDTRWLLRGAKARRTKAKGRIEESSERRDELSSIASRNAAAAPTSAGLDFNASGRKTRKLLVATGVAKSMGGRRLFQDFDIEVVPGECIGLMGPNGSGKTTMLRVLLGELAPDVGTVKRADPAPRVASMTQTRSEFPVGTLLSEAIAPFGDKVRFRDVEMHVTAWSRRFLFRDEQLLQQVSMLSGGELARAHVARMMLDPADILVLDEPTNDLDIPTLEVLEDAVEGFAGATLLVTHDRAMLSRLASRIVVLGAPDGVPRVVASLPQALRVLHEFENHVATPIARAATPATKPSAKPIAVTVAKAASTPSSNAPKKKLSYNEQRESDNMEKSISTAEAKAADLEAQINDPKLLADHAAYAKACEVLATAHAEVTRLYTRWATIEAKRG